MRFGQWDMTTVFCLEVLKKCVMLQLGRYEINNNNKKNYWFNRHFIMNNARYYQKDVSLKHEEINLYQLLSCSCHRLFNSLCDI